MCLISISHKYTKEIQCLKGRARMDNPDKLVTLHRQRHKTNKTKNNISFIYRNGKVNVCAKYISSEY